MSVEWIRSDEEESEDDEESVEEEEEDEAGAGEVEVDFSEKKRTERRFDVRILVVLKTFSITL